MAIRNCCFMAILLIAIAATKSKADMMAEHEAIKTSCSAATNTPASVIKEFFSGKLSDEDVSEPLKCHIKCVMEKLGHLKNGAADEAAMAEMFTNLPLTAEQKQSISKTISDCKNEKGANDCDTAYKIISCFMKSKSGEVIRQHLEA